MIEVGNQVETYICHVLSQCNFILQQSCLFLAWKLFFSFFPSFSYILSIYLSIYLFIFWNRTSVCNPCWPWTHYIALTSLELLNPCLSLQSAGITVLYHHDQLIFLSFFFFFFFFLCCYGWNSQTSCMLGRCCTTQHTPSLPFFLNYFKMNFVDTWHVECIP
jgi:hypothetical protein